MTQTNLFPERHNTGLFSQYYLDEILLPSFGKDPGTSKQADLGDSYFREKFEILEPIIRKNEETAAKRSERQLEDDVIQPILKHVLGHFFDVAPRYKGDVPDYVLFPSEENKIQARSLSAGSDEYQKLNVGILDAKAWRESRKAGIGDEANISQIFRYLINFRRRWGILTDGFRWILFANKPGIRQDQYIEFNLSDIIRNEKRDQAANFKLFVFLFRRQAFERQPKTDALLDAVLDESFRNAEQLQSDLKTKVYKAFEIVAEGYRSYNRLPLTSPEQIHDLKEASLIFLYRILFLLFGESRLILPVRPMTEAYYALSLENLIENRIDKELKHFPTVTRYWSALQDLFELIHGLEEDGTPSRMREEIGLPIYNGGLFDPHKYPNVAKWKLGDKAVKEVMDLLTKTGQKKKENVVKPVRVSYRDLGVQHLGNIYEGILENHITVTAEGAIEIVTDKKERKATGSYYTPDYIVDYIVQETLAPLLPEEAGQAPTRKKKTNDEESPQEKLLRIKVLDPAMGSGHFLVGAIDFLAEKLAVIAHPGGLYTESELQECRRRVAERCIYGVDLNPMAVELAKLSIWLHTISNDKPLTFLDNHIKCGNALIGARISDLDALPQKKKQAKNDENQAGLFPKTKLTQEVAQWLAEGRIFKDASNTIDEVKAKEKLEKELDERRSKYRHLADLWTASYFLSDSPSFSRRGQGVVTPSLDTELSILFHKLSEAIVVNADEAPLPKSELLDEALRIAKEKRFFHWELEFPEIFFDKHGRRNDDEAGFDAVIGNPPYVRQETLGDTKELYYQPNYSTYSNTADIYVYFYELGNRVMKRGGRQGLITSNKFIRSTYGKPLREFLKNNVALKEIIDFGELRVFADAAPMPVVVVVANGETKEQSFKFTQVKTLDFPNLKDVVDSSGVILGDSALQGENWSLSSLSDARIRDKMNSGSVTLDEYCNKAIYYGIKTGYNEAFVINQNKHDELIKKDPGSAEILKPFLAGDDIRKYEINFRNRYLIWTYNGVPINKYPAIFAHLQTHQAKLEARQDQGDHWWELRACTYYDVLNSAKILYPDIAMSSRFTIDTEGLYMDTTAFCIPGSDLYLLALLNSRLLFRMLTLYAPSLGDMAKGGRLRMKTVYLEQLPICRISFTTPKKEREKLTQSLIKQTGNILNSIDRETSIEQIQRGLLPSIELAKQYSASKNDVLHDFLSHLAEEMLAMNKEKQTLAQGFYTWMGHYNIPPRETMKPKTILDEFWKLEFKEILTHLKKNKVPVSTSTQDDLLKRFTEASSTLNALDKKIENTDWLIDRVVYALYGLTDEEIAIVEQS